MQAFCSSEIQGGSVALFFNVMLTTLVFMVGPSYGFVPNMQK
jgi:hypothetical protein